MGHARTGDVAMEDLQKEDMEGGDRIENAFAELVETAAVRSKFFYTPNDGFAKLLQNRIDKQLRKPNI